MSKKKKSDKKIKKGTARKAPQSSAAVSQKTLASNYRFFPIIIFLLGFLFYSNTLGHQYALDDASVITDNFVVKKGTSGLSTIFTTNYRYGYWNSSGTLYRPMSLAIFATVWQISPNNPFFYHLINVLLFALTGVVLYKVLRRFWPEQHPLVALAVSLIFVAHPVHVEVVANIKSLDEILALLFSLLALHQFLDYLKTAAMSKLVIAVSLYFLAMFSKENAITFLAVFPLTAYFFSDKNWMKKMGAVIPFLIPVAAYLVMRFVVLETATLGPVSPLDNLLAATDGVGEWYATAFVLLGKYLLVLLAPITMGSDFGYSQIPVTGFGNIKAILSLLVYLGLFVFAILGLKNRDKTSYGILFFLITFSIFTNLFITIGSSYGERFLYMPSVGFCIALVYGVLKLTRSVDWAETKKISELFSKNKLFFIITMVLFVGYAGKTITRNPAWFNSYSLYKTDIETSPNSAKLNYHLALEEVQEFLSAKDQNQKQAFQNSAITHFKKAISLYPSYSDAYSQLGLMYYRQKNNAEALKNYKKALEFNPKDAKTYSNMGVIYFESRDLQKAEEVYLEAVEYDPRFLDARRNLGSVYAQTKRFDQAIAQFNEGLKYDPNNATLHLFLGYVYRDMGDANTAKRYFDKAYALDPGLRR